MLPVQTAEQLAEMNAALRYLTDGFNEYLRNKADPLGARTRSVYVSVLKRALLAMGKVDSAQFLLQYHASLCPGSMRNTFRTVWQSFCFCCSENNWPSPPPLIEHRPGPQVDRTDDCGEFIMPVDQQRSVAFLIKVEEIPARAIHAATWADILKRDSGGIALRQVLRQAGRHRTKAYHRLSEQGVRALAVLKRHAAPKDEKGKELGSLPPSVPLVPMWPGSHIPITAGLAQWIADSLEDYVTNERYVPETGFIPTKRTTPVPRPEPIVTPNVREILRYLNSEK